MCCVYPFCAFRLDLAHEKRRLAIAKIHNTVECTIYGFLLNDLLPSSLMAPCTFFLDILKSQAQRNNTLKAVHYWRSWDPRRAHVLCSLVHLYSSSHLYCVSGGRASQLSARACARGTSTYSISVVFELCGLRAAGSQGSEFILVQSLFYNSKPVNLSWPSILAYVKAVASNFLFELCAPLLVLFSSYSLTAVVHSCVQL